MRRTVRSRTPGSPAVLESFVASNVTEEARTRGFPSPPFGEFGFDDSRQLFNAKFERVVIRIPAEVIIIPAKR